MAPGSVAPDWCAKVLRFAASTQKLEAVVSSEHHHQADGVLLVLCPPCGIRACTNWFLLIIRGFVKEAVFNADVIHQLKTTRQRPN